MGPMRALLLGGTILGCSPGVDQKAAVEVSVDEAGQIYVDGERSKEMEDAMKMPRSKPRPHHFQFAKLWLPQLALSNPKEFVDIFGQPAGKEYLVNLWNGVAKELPRDEQIPSDGLSLELSAQIAGPKTPNECYFVAAVFESDNPISLRLFGLEKADVSEAHPDGSALIEWDRKGRYSYRASPKPLQAPFVSRLGEIVSSSEDSLTFTDLRPFGWFAQPTDAELE